MASLYIDKGSEFFVDRDGIAWDHPESKNQGMEIHINGLCIHFKDENDSVGVAKAILKRMGLLSITT